LAQGTCLLSRGL